MFPEAYSVLEAIADEPQNITSEVRRLILLEDPYRGSTDKQDRAYRDLDRMTCEETKNLTKYLGLNSGVLPAIKFTHNFVSKMCKDAALAKELRDLSLCSAIPIPGMAFAKELQRKHGNIARSTVYQELDLDDNWDIVFTRLMISSVKQYSQKKGECDTHPSNQCLMVPKILLLKKHLYGNRRRYESDNEQKKKIINLVIVLLCNVKGKHPQKLEEEKDFNNNKVKILKEHLKEKTEQVQQMIRDQAKEYNENKAAMQKKEEIWQSKESLLVGDLTDALKIIDQLRIEKERLEEQKDEEIRELKIHERMNSNRRTFRTTTIIDTGASTCCINKKVIPKEALEPLTHTVFFNGLNSRQQATHRIKQGYFLIEGNKFKIPLIYAFDMRDSNEIAELEVSEEEFLKINESIYFNQERSRAFQEQFKPVIDRLKQQGYIGEEPLKHWKKNGELCKLDIINLDITIEDRPLKHVTPVMEDSFRKHVDSLLKIGAIHPSKSRHRTMEMIVNSGTTINPVTGREVKGKERMRIGGAKIFLKYDLKLGFHQVAMDEESIPWTAFLGPGGLYEWLVMPFVYINDILVFSKNEKDHAKHLEQMLKICEDNGLVLSPTKMKIAVSTVDFLGAVIGEGTIKLQPHIIKKIVNFNEEELKTKKGLSQKNQRTSSKSSDLEIPPENAHIILETDGCMEGWGGIVKWKKSKEDPRSSERICAYASGKFSTTQSTIDAEINACINTLEKLKIYYLDKQEVTLRTDCQAIISFYNKTNSNKSSRVRWIKFADAVTGTGVKINIEHIEGKHNTLVDSLSRLVNLCFAECTREMKELAAAALYSVEEVLLSPNAFQKNMKTTCEEVMKISNHFLESSQKLSSHLKNQEHYTNVTSLRPIKP
ncbi:Orf y [Tanacetum coccineum]|uniref:RNA-directed DNA polymerase n=1 Tax=Tanacetum coccineum TaxID=301880 RepID=A0ABQ5F8L0_9ASTR